ncbi:hypothetical protein PV328_010140 [Microctonus aethiopoides]|uniref:HYDIN/VesB/CFA65-like Ig-like domain-containing protein n=2 Tax=Microctonus aethiopoides TaxID=144406 RepID=A0AA39C798_9HYME|nr:hypothetical protein PV328_010140 [Microctonus aethiopoides]
MEAKNLFNRLIDESFTKKYDITSILYQYVVHERKRNGQGDDNESKNLVALYPSEYKKQILLSTYKRLELLTIPIRNINQPSVVHSFPLNVVPREIIFQQFTPGNSYTTTLLISNTSKISQFVKLICQQNETFCVDIKGTTINIRLAPGMSHVYNIQFNPHEKQDYEHQIDLFGDFGTVTIPIIALGPRAILDFPDNIMMPDTPVNSSSSRPILIRNSGDSTAIFDVFSSSPHFLIEPLCGAIKQGESQQFIIDFVAPSTGSFTSIIYFRYETGELLKMNAHGTGINCSVHLETDELHMGDTFLGLSSAKSLKIFNNSEHIVKFHWMKHENITLDNEEKNKFTEIYGAIEDLTIKHHNDLECTSLFDSSILHDSIHKRVRTDEVNSLATEKFFYNDSKFILSPMAGEIWPKSFVEITVTFQPHEIGEILSEAYLEVTGCKTRLPIRFFGIGKGPILKLNATAIDIGKVYLNSVQNFEIICANEGLIPGIIIPNEKSSDFGGKISISPQILEIQPGEYSSFNLSFSSTKNGEFIETIEFLNQDNAETISLYIKGIVVCPTLHFDQSQLDLGTVALGFTSKHEVLIQNMSSVAVTFSISIPDDGDEPAVTYETFINTTNNISVPPIFPSNPREFFISPNNTTLAAHTSLSIKESKNTMTFYSMSRNQWHLNPGQSCDASVTIITRVIGQQEIEMKMRTFGKSEFDTLTAVFNGHGPVMSIVPKHLDFGDVELLQEKLMSLELINDSPIPANFNAYIANKNSSWSISMVSGEINPLKSMKMDVKLFLRDAGKQFDEILINIANGSTFSVTLSAHGLGSCIKIHPNIFPDFKMGQLLSHQDNFVLLNLINEGNRLQKIIFSNSITRRNSRSVPQMPLMTRFKVESHAIELLPRSSKEIKWLVQSDKCDNISEQWWVYCVSQGHAKRELIGISNFSATFIDPAVKFNKTEMNFYINMETHSKKSADEKVIDELEIINTSQMNLKIHLSIQYPFQIITENDEHVNNAIMNLKHNFISRIRVCFTPNIEYSENFQSRNYINYLRFKYNEHPNEDEIKCKAAVNYPNIIPIPKNLRFDVSINEPCNKTLVLNNNGPMPVDYNFSWETPGINNRLNSKGVLSIKPMEGSIDSGTVAQLELNYQSRIPGQFDESFNLIIEKLEPIVITIKGWAVLPQIYLPLPRILSTKNHLIEDEYNAINTLNIVEQLNTHENVDLSLIENKNELERLMNNGWEIISNCDDSIPEIMDIEMIIEHYLAVQHICECETLTNIHISSKNLMPIPLLYSQPYELNLGCVIVEQCTNRSVMIYNYSSCKVSIRLRKNEKENYLTKYGITVKLQDRFNLMSKEFSRLDINIHPLKKKFLERSKLIKRKIYIEVINGCTIPITIIANVTSPWLMLSKNTLDFGHVIVGNCKLLRLFIRNDGLIKCQWNMKFSNDEKKSQLHFYLDNYQDSLLSGESKTIDIYFRPEKSGNYETELNIILNEGIEPQKIFLYGRGIERKLKIDKLSINFPPMSLYSMARVHKFNVKNNVNCPIEFYWNHLDHVSIEENHIMRVLLHYYGVNEILLPLLDVGFRIPRAFYDFYYSLIDEMTASEDFISNQYSECTVKSQLEQLEDVSTADPNFKSSIDEEINKNNLSEFHEKNSNTNIIKSESIKDSSDNLNYQLFEGLMSLRSRNPDEIEDLLHSYIDKLHKIPDFLKLRNDPLKEIFDELTARNKNNVLEKKVCIFFHGAPFTQYQETACRIAKLLNLSLINLDSAIIEIIALSDSSNSIQLREMIDNKYQELLQIATRLTNNFEPSIPLNKILKSGDFSSLGSDDNEELQRFKKNIYFNLPEPDDPIVCFKNLPSIDEINLMDPLCRYEYKIEGIRLLQNIITESEAVSFATTAKSKSRKKKVGKNLKTSKKITQEEETFFGIDLNYLEIVLQEIFNSSQYRKGFVLQTLNNNFIKNNVTTLASIFRIVGREDFMAFVTFHNSLDLYKQKYTETQNEIIIKQKEELAIKLEMIDEMSSSDFELLPDDEKCLFIEKVLRPRIHKAQERRMKFTKKYETEKSDPAVELNEKNKKVKISNEKQIKFESDKLEKLTEAFNVYKINLKLIESVINNHFHIWHVKFSNPWDSEIYDMVVSQLMENQIIKQILNENNTSQPVIESQLYSIITANNRRYEYQSREKSPFNLIALSEDSDSDENLPDLSKLKKYVEKLPQPRVILQPKEIKTFQIVLKPTCIGLFTDKFLLSIVGDNTKTYKIDVAGNVDIPHLQMDPTIIFPNVKQTQKNELHRPVFFIDENTFDFGYLLVNKNDNNERKIHKIMSRLNFFNPSPVDVNVQFSLANSNYAAFNLTPQVLLIKPNEFGSIQVTAVALEYGINTDRLLIMIKNNPRVEEVTLTCFGCELDVTLNKKNLSFGRVLLYRKIHKIVTLKNKSAIPIFWKNLSGIFEDSQITLSQLSDWLKAFSESNIEICYHGQSVGPIEKLINIGIFLDDIDENPLLIESITVSGNTCDVAVDINNASPIIFPNGKIDTNLKASFSIKNRGQHDINFVIEMMNMENICDIDRNLLKNLKEDFHVDPSFGLLKMNETTAVNVTFIPKLEMNLKEMPLFKCKLLETNKNPTVVAEIPLTVTIRVECNRFEIEPYPEVLIGPIRIFTHKQISFYMKNIGIFPIHYEITSKQKNTSRASSIQTQQLGKNNKKVLLDDKESCKSRKSPRKKKSTPKVDRSFLQFGPFTLNQSHEGTLDIHQVAEFIIDCYPEAEGHLEDSILIFVDNSSINDKNGRILKFSMDSYIPKIDFSNLNFIFQDSHMVNCLKDFECPSEVTPFTIFTKEGMNLHFEGVIVSTTYTVKLRFNNPSLVSADLLLFLQTDELHQKNSQSRVFTLDKLNLHILPLSTEQLSISFAPTLLEKYSGLLEAFIDVPSHIKTDKLSIKLFGEGCIAEIVLIEPEIFCKRGHAILKYGKCLVGETSYKNICFKNIGKIRTTITIEIIEDTECLYELKIIDEVSITKIGMIDRHCIEMISKPGDVTQLLLLFSPKDNGKYEAHVRLLIAENPYESLMINLNGEGFIEPVILIGLPLLETTNDHNETTKDAETNSLKQNSNENEMYETSVQKNRSASLPVLTNKETPLDSSISLIYTLNIGDCYLNEEKNITFKMTNKSADKLFRFQWNTHNNLTIIPSVGYIYPLDHKDIVVSFISDIPVSLDQIPLDCTISEINIMEKPEGVAWDDQHSRVDWIKFSPSNENEDDEYSEEIFMEKIVQIIDEPRYENVGPARVIQILLTASASHSIYACSIDEINFEDTFIYEIREQKFILKNAGLVNLIYSWELVESSIYHSASFINNSLQASIDSLIHEANESYTRHENSEFMICSTNANVEIMNNKKYEPSFEIEPTCGVLLSDQSKQFTVRFLPRSAVFYRAKLTCHGPTVPENIKVVEFKVVGVRKNHIKHFDLINPTAESYHFSWIDKTSQNTENIPYFHCKTPEAIANSGEKTKITFTFLARDVGVFEALWLFFIHEYNLEVPFLLVGIVTEPRVICCTPKVTMALTSLGVKVQDTMIIRNNEKFPLSFKINENSVYSEGRLQNINIKPTSGILSGENDQEFLVDFKPKQIGHFSFLVKCEIEKMKEPLKCFITANVCEISSRVIFINSTNEQIDLQTDKVNIIESGKLMLKKLTVFKFEIINIGDITFKYEWNLGMRMPTKSQNNRFNYKIEIKETNGEVDSRSKIITFLEITAMKKLELKNHLVTLKVINGPLYKLLINATAKCEPIKFSFIEYNFGACYINENTESSQYNVELQITNNENTFVIVECNKVPQHFSVNFEKLSQAISERSTISIPINFHPREMKKYHESLNFIINSTIDQEIQLKGEGVVYKVGLLKPRDKVIDFGNVSIGKIVKRKFTIINFGKASVKLQIGLIKKIKNHSNPINIPDIFDDYINFEPSEFLTLRPNKIQEIIIKFSPKKRMNIIDEKIGGFCGETTIIPLLLIRGRCIAAEFNVNRTDLRFDTVAKGYSIEDKLILNNSGDIDAHFKWNVKKLGPHFTLKPLKGYSSAGTNVTFNVYFHPTKESIKIKGEASIEIENYQTITILFSGGCSKLPDPIDTIIFSIPVRSKETKNIDLKNDSNVDEKIEVIVTGNYFQSENFIFIDANSSTQCAITYAPLVMNTKINPHEGTVVMKYSRKNSLTIYALRGISLPPEAIGEISREIPAKIKYLEILRIYNWLDKPQKFVCAINLIGNHKEKPIYTFDGSDKIEILSKDVRDYHAVLCCYKGSLLNFHIIFTNPEGEYQFYKLQYKIINPKSIETIELTTNTQKSVDYLLKIENPLKNESINYSGTCQHPDIKIEGLPKSIAPGSKETIIIHYSPSIVSECETALDIISKKLGIFPYKLKLKAIMPEKIFYTLPQITVALGSSKTFNIIIKNNSKNVDVFTITITGNGIIPKPKGPFTLMPNYPLTIPFKNVFLDIKAFKYIVDPTVLFATSSSSNVINSKQTANIMVKFQNMNEFKDESGMNTGAVTGKLIVYCTDPELSSINWIYYLKGTLK